jgi:hypothetical protein
LLTGQAAAQAGGQVGAANAIGGAAQNVGNMAYLQSLIKQNPSTVYNAGNSGVYTNQGSQQTQMLQNQFGPS